MSFASIGGMCLSLQQMLGYVACPATWLGPCMFDTQMWSSLGGSLTWCRLRRVNCGVAAQFDHPLRITRLPLHVCLEDHPVIPL